jgi:RNA polymerase sigma factor (sigma-70 family)
MKNKVSPKTELALADEMQKFLPDFVALFTQVTRDKSLAEDLAQDVALKVLQQFRQGEKIKNVPGYMFTLGYRLFLDRIKSYAHSKTDAISAGHMNSLATIHAGTLGSQGPYLIIYEEELRALIAAIDPEALRAFELRSEGLTLKEIEGALGIPFRKVSERMNHVRDKLAKLDPMLGRLKRAKKSLARSSSADLPDLTSE